MLMALAGLIPALGLIATAGLVLWAVRRDGREAAAGRAQDEGSRSESD